MLEPIQGLPPGIVGVRAAGKVTKRDYEHVLEPLFDEARQRGEKVRLLYQFSPEFEGFSGAAALEDARFGLRSLRQLAACAVVSDIGWLRESMRFVAFWMPCPIHGFTNAEIEKASAWLASQPEKAGITHRILSDSGVIVVEITTALRAEDFDTLAMAADDWLHAKGSLNGLVIHAKSFPGWENLQGLIRHIRFVRDHHKKVRRIALASDAALASLAPQLAEHFVKAEIERFGYDELDQAITWCQQGAEPGE